jgi:ribosomal protein L17
MSKDAIRLMDDHIANMHNASTNTTATEVFKPSICYENFYQTKMSSNEMTKEIEKIIEKYETASAAAAGSARENISPDELTNEIIDKIKKTYKNRYYKFASLQQPK